MPANMPKNARKKPQKAKILQNAGFGMEFAFKGSKRKSPPVGINFNNGRIKDARKNEVKQNDQAFSRSNRR